MPGARPSFGWRRSRGGAPQSDGRGGGSLQFAANEGMKVGCLSWSRRSHYDRGFPDRSVRASLGQVAWSGASSCLSGDQLRLRRGGHAPTRRLGPGGMPPVWCLLRPAHGRQPGRVRTRCRHCNGAGQRPMARWGAQISGARLTLYNGTGQHSHSGSPAKPQSAGTTST